MKILLKTLFIVLLTALMPAFYCQADEEKAKEALIMENQALKKELDALKWQLAESNDKGTLKASSETTNDDFAKETIPEVSSPLIEAPVKDSTLVQVPNGNELPKVDKIEEDTDEIVVTATRTKQSIKDVGSSITVITKEQIENSKAPLILDVLRNVPGIEVTRTQGIGGTTSIFMRGGDSAHTLVFIDGVQANSTTSGSFNFANLTTDNIERIEILRGPQSTLYGSEAMGGVINIITVKGEGETKIAIGSEYGTHETYREKFNLSGGKEKVDYSAGVSYLKTHGISDASSGREEDGYENFTGSVRVGREFMDSGRVDTTLRVSHSDFELDSFTFPVGPTDDEDRRQKSEEVYFSTKAENTFFDIWTPSILVSVNDTELEGLDLTEDANEFRIPTRLWRAEHQSDINVTDFDTATLGFEFEVQEGENDGKFDKQTTYNRGAFFQNQIEIFDGLNWTAGLRYDRHSAFGVHYTYRSTLSYNLENVGARLHGSWGKGFRAPSINELFFPNFGNPGLNPEESKGWDVGIEKTIIENKLNFDITYFENDFTDLIIAAAQPDGSFIAENVSKAEAEGFESLLTFKPYSKIALIGTYTYTDTTDRGKNDQLPRRPRNRASLSLNTQPLEKLNLNLTGIMVRDRIDSVDGADMEDYWTANLAAKYTFTELMAGYLRFENLFDRDYEEVTGFDTLDLTVYGGVDFTF